MHRGLPTRSHRGHSHCLLLLCVAHAAVQVRCWRRLAQGHAGTLMGNLPASTADVASAAARESCTAVEQAKSAKRATTCSVVRMQQCRSARLQLAPSVPTTPCCRHNNTNEGRKRVLQLQKCFSKSAALWKHCNCSSTPLLQSCYISPLQKESAFGLFPRCTFPASRRSLHVRSCLPHRMPQRQAHL